MESIIPKSLQDAATIAVTTLLTQIGAFLPRFLAALIVFLVGIAVAKWIKQLSIKMLEMLRLSKGLKSTPLESFLQNAEIGKIEYVIGTVVYWLFMLVILHATVSLLGLEAVSILLGRILQYIPNIFAAVLILFFGVLISGVVESLVKGAIRSIDGKSALALGKISSYLVVIVAVMAAISELRIAQQFIVTLFTGFVAMLALALGLAFGLGSKEVVGKFMGSWYEKMKKDMEE